MANIEIQNNVTRALEIWNPVYDDATLVSATAQDLVAGTLLARTGANLEVYEAGVSGDAMAILPNDVSIGAGEQVPIRPALGGQVRRRNLVVHGGTVTQAEVDMLRDYSIIALNSEENTEPDNQP